MKFIRLVITFSLLMGYTLCQSQADELYAQDFLETTTDLDKFSLYQDSIEKYLYRDAELTSKIFDSCERLINDGLVPNDSLLFIYTINEILYNHSTLNALRAYEIFLEKDQFLKSEDLPSKYIAAADYLRAFTLMSIGDLEAAQKSFYLNVESSKLKKDTSKIISNLYSLGQLYNDEGDYQAALKCYDEIELYNSTHDTKTSTLVLIQAEITETKTNMEDYEGALINIDKGLSIAFENDMNFIANDLLLLKGNVYLKQEKIGLAEKVYAQLQSISKTSFDPNGVSNSTKFLAKLYEAKKMYPQAIETHKEVLVNIDSSDLKSKIDVYSYLQDVSNKMQNHKSAYSYLLKHNELLDQKLEDEKRKKTAYLKIKYNSEQKEKDNAVLEAEIIKNKTERTFLYALLGFIGLFLIILFNAFYQKQQYNKLLEVEVERRTSKLKESNDLYQKSNQELDEFNRILSHDLKEPLRSIVGFSQLAANNVTAESKAHKYLGIVKKSGEQLNKLIEDVGKYRNTETIDSESKTLISVKGIIEKTINKLELDYPEKKLIVNISDHFPAIQGNPSTLLSIFSSILENSVKFNDQEEVKININYNSDSSDHIFQVEDNGIGVPEAYHDQIFDMFKRLNNRNKYPGSGLGLSVAKKMIIELGGTISVLRSKLNEGTTMQLKLSK